MKKDNYLHFVKKEKNIIIDKLLKDAGDDISLYSGKSGGLLFLVELYSSTKNDEDLDKIDAIIPDILNQYNDVTISSYALYTGNVGLSYTLLKLYDLTGDEKYLDTAIKILRNCKKHFEFIKNPIIELINGISGTLLGLTQLLNTGYSQKWLLEDIDFYVEYILNNTFLDNKKGIFWDPSSKNVKGLTGFSHGASGIGFVFNQLYKVTGSEGFKAIAQLSFDYEDTNYDDQTNNWLDLRNSPYIEEQEAPYMLSAKKEDINFFVKKKNMLAWCHGAPGILLSRSDTSYNNKTTDQAIDSVLSSLDKIHNHCICHSTIGNALCMMSVLPQNIELSNKLKELSDQLLDHYEKHKTFLTGYKSNVENNNLFMGSLGPLYFLLKVSEYLEFGTIEHNILKPEIRSNKNNSFNTHFNKYSEKYILKKILFNRYPNTIELLDQNEFIVNYSLNNFEETFISDVTNISDSKILSALHFEKEKRDVEKSTVGYNYNYFRTFVDIQLLKKTNDSELLKKQVKVNDSLRIITTEFTWDSKERVKNATNYAFVANYPVCTAIRIEKFAQSLIEMIQEKESIKIQDVSQFFLKLIPGVNKKEIDVYVINGVKALIQKGVIRIVHE